jgi:PAS domain-containing protein
MMQRFICEQNIAHFDKLLSESRDVTLVRTLHVLLASAKRELSLLEASDRGADSSLSDPHRRPRADVVAIKRHFQQEFDASPHPYMLIDPGPGLYIADINAAYAAATFTDRQAIAGKSLFEVFPDNPDEPLADGVNNLYGSLRMVVQTGHPHAMAIQRYDIRNAESVFVERHWQPINTPLHDEQGRLAFILHHVEDVTQYVKAD